MSSVLYSCPSSVYIFTKKRTPGKENFNNYCKILITPILHSGTTQEIYLELVKHLQWSFFTKIINGLKLLTIFAKTLHPRCLFDKVLNMPLNSERVP